VVVQHKGTIVTTGLFSYVHVYHGTVLCRSSHRRATTNARNVRNTKFSEGATTTSPRNNCQFEKANYFFNLIVADLEKRDPKSQNPKSQEAWRIVAYWFV
jgi:hypothetical protein